MSKILSDPSFRLQVDKKRQWQLKTHADEIEKKQEILMIEKLEKQNEKNIRVKEIQSNFVRWAQQKNEENALKFEKVEKNKEENIAKIVKKCQERDKFVSKKFQDFKVTKRKNLNSAWRRAEKLTQDIQNYHKSKHLLKKSRDDHSADSKPQQTFTQNFSEADLNDQTSLPNQRQPIKINSNSVYINNTSNPISPLNNNSTFYIGKFYQGNNEKERQKQKQRFIRVHSSQSVNVDEGGRVRNHQIFEKFKQLSKNEQDQRIQELGQKLQKIQKTRVRRMKIIKHQTKDQQNQRSRNRQQIDYETKKGNVGKSISQKKNYRLNSEHSYKRESRIKDRTFDVKARQQQMFEKNIVEGYEYLENLKIRHLKTVLQKNICYNTLQKKLFIQRMNN